MDQADEQPAWQLFFQEHGARLLLFARQQTRSEADAHDVLQEAFVSIWKQGEGSLPERPAKVFAAVRCAAIDRARSESSREVRERTWHDERQPVTQWFERRLEADERRSQLEEAVRQLPNAQRDVLSLKIWGELTFEEIGESLDISPNTAASRYRYALSNLRNLLQSKDLES